MEEKEGSIYFLCTFWVSFYLSLSYLFPSTHFPSQVDWVGCGGRDALLAGGQLLEQGLG